MTNEKDKPAASASPAAGVELLGNRTREVTLEFPARFHGVTYEKVSIRRMSPAEVSTFIARAAAADADAENVPVEMLDIPREVFLGLDPDDRDNVEEAIYDFLPRRLQMGLALAQETGAATSPSPQASSEGESSNTSA